MSSAITFKIKTRSRRSSRLPIPVSRKTTVENSRAKEKQEIPNENDDVLPPGATGENKDFPRNLGKDHSKRPVSARLYETSTAASRARRTGGSKITPNQQEKATAAAAAAPPAGGSPIVYFLGKNQPKIVEGDGNLNLRILTEARKTGQINLSNQNLKALPEQVWNINESYLSLAGSNASAGP